MAAARLSELGLSVSRGQDCTITGLASDHRKLEKDGLFVALSGLRAHGISYLDQAIERGAIAVLTDPAGAAQAVAQIDAALADGRLLALCITQAPRAALAGAAALWFGAQPSHMVAVTGTNGKTSIASFTRQIWQAMGKPAVNLGTVGVEGDWHAPLAHTTPDPITLHEALAGAATAGITHAAMEASSHGLDQNRLDAVQIQAAGFSNFTQDHLDYHHDLDSYFAAKARLFQDILPSTGTAVINIDDPKLAEFATALQAAPQGPRVLTVGHDADADLRILATRAQTAGLDLRLQYGAQIAQVYVPLIGAFQADNLALAAGLVIACGAPAADVFAALPRVSGVRGRMQLAGCRANGAAVFVDYAHTPDAVKTALTALRPHVLGQLVAIIGAGGDRDSSKRPLMGSAAAASADRVIITDDNPRSEDPAAIRDAVQSGAPDAQQIPDRAEAILRAVHLLGPGDALLIAGKGHETGQVYDGVTYPFDDIEQASLAIAALEGRA